MLFPFTFNRYNRYETTGYREWAKAVKLKCKYTCYICGKFSKNVHAHHIENYNKKSKKNIAIKNGVCLCPEHHYNFHLKYGFSRNNRQQLEEFKKSYQASRTSSD